MRVSFRVIGYRAKIYKFLYGGNVYYLPLMYEKWDMCKNLAKMHELTQMLLTGSEPDYFTVYQQVGCLTATGIPSTFFPNHKLKNDECPVLDYSGYEVFDSNQNGLYCYVAVPAQEVLSGSISTVYPLVRLTRSLRLLDYRELKRYADEEGVYVFRAENPVEAVGMLKRFVSNPADTVQYLNVLIEIPEWADCFSGATGIISPSLEVTGADGIELVLNIRTPILGLFLAHFGVI